MNDLCRKISLLVEERGWSSDQFARASNLSPGTVYNILQGVHQHPQKATVAACAEALGLTVHDLHELPLDRLLPRMRSVEPHQLREALASQPELMAWRERNPER